MEDDDLQKFAEEMSRLPMNAITSTLADAIGGSASAHVLRDYIRIAATAVRDGEPLWDELRQFIADALTAISYGEDANKALRLELGHKRPANRVDEVRIAYFAWDLINRQNFKVEDAFRHVGQQIHKSPYRIREIYYRQKTAIDAELSGKASHSKRE